MSQAVAETASAWSPHLSGVRGGVATYLPGDEFGPRTLNDYELVWVTAGSARYEHDGVQQAVPAGGVILARPGFRERYRWDRRHTSRHAFVHFTIESPAAGWPDASTWPVVRVPSAGDALRPMFRRMINGWWRRAGINPFGVEPALDRLLVAMIDAFLTPDVPPRLEASASPPVQRAIDWIHATLQRKSDATIELDAIARAAHVNPSHLARLFRRWPGITPMRFVQLMRLEQAMVLLERSNLNMGEVARRCGFVSSFHFSRVFSRAYGHPPTLVRQALRSGQPRPPSPLPIEPPPIEP